MFLLKALDGNSGTIVILEGSLNTSPLFSLLPCDLACYAHDSDAMQGE